MDTQYCSLNARFDDTLMDPMPSVRPTENYLYIIIMVLCRHLCLKSAPDRHRNAWRVGRRKYPTDQSNNNRLLSCVNH